MSEFTGTPHNSAKVGDIAKTVIMPGDPLRAKFIAETFLEDAKEFNHVRGMLGYTGKYKGVDVSVMGHGMGIPSVGIYSFELYKFYGVENIIRIGSCGGLLPEMELFDIVLADSAYSPSSYAKIAFGYDGDLMYPSKELTDKLAATAESQGKRSSAESFTAATVSTPIRSFSKNPNMTCSLSRWKVLVYLPTQNISGKMQHVSSRSPINPVQRQLLKNARPHSKA